MPEQQGLQQEFNSERSDHNSQYEQPQATYQEEGRQLIRDDDTRLAQDALRDELETIEDYQDGYREQTSLQPYHEGDKLILSTPNRRNPVVTFFKGWQDRLGGWKKRMAEAAARREQAWQAENRRVHEVLTTQDFSTGLRLGLEDAIQYPNGDTGSPHHLGREERKTVDGMVNAFLESVLQRQKTENGQSRNVSPKDIQDSLHHAINYAVENRHARAVIEQSGMEAIQYVDTDTGALVLGLLNHSGQLTFAAVHASSDEAFGWYNGAPSYRFFAIDRDREDRDVNDFHGNVRFSPNTRYHALSWEDTTHDGGLEVSLIRTLEQPVIGGKNVSNAIELYDRDKEFTGGRQRKNTPGAPTDFRVWLERGGVGEILQFPIRERNAQFQKPEST